MMTYSNTDIAELAKVAAGNWAKFDSFVWWEKPDNAANYTLVYTGNRDSCDIDRANAQVIAEALKPYIGRTVRVESHNHWACGHIDGYAIQVYTRKGAITKAFRLWVELQQRMEDYPVLDDDKLSEVQSEDEQQAWDGWARRDFERQIEKQFDCELNTQGDELDDIFQKARDAANTYWEHDNSGPSINIERTAAAVQADDIRALVIPKAVTIYRNGDVYATGSIQLDRWSCDLPLYEREFSLCMAADDDEESDVVIDGALFTWKIS